MKMKVFLCILIVCFFAGCRTPEPPPAPPPPPPPPPPAAPPRPQVIERMISLQPVTTALIKGLDKHGVVPSFQYYISDAIVLISDSDGKARGSNNRGTLELSSDFAREIIIIDPKTKGEVIDLRRNDAGKLVLEACFETENPTATLRFIESREEGFFNLEIEDGETIQYGSDRYQVRMGVDRIPRLMINVENVLGPRTPPRRVPGRDITPDKSSGPREFLLEIEPPVSKLMVPEEESVIEEKTFPGEEFVPEEVITMENTGEFIPEIAQVFEGLSSLAFSPAVPAEANFWPMTIEEIPEIKETSSSIRSSRQPVYKVQVGSFVNRNNAEIVFKRLSAAGFKPVYEKRNNFHRVVVPGVGADELDDVTRRLGRIGFSNPWIR